MDTMSGKNQCSCCNCEIPPGQTKCARCNRCMHRQVGFPLGLGILLFPIIFAWFTLRHGYSTFARVVSFVWLIICLLGVFAAPQFGYYSVTTSFFPEQMRMQTDQMSANSNQQ